jgi:hypothetical protein
MVDFVRALKWPVITWIVLDALFYIAGMVYSPAAQLFTPDIAAAMALVFGAWAGSKIVAFKGTYLHAAGGGIVLGAVCLVLCMLGGFGLQLGAYMGLMNLSGALIGAGYALTK